MQAKGLKIHSSTIYRWFFQYSPILSKNIRKRLKSTSDSWRIDETYLKIPGKDMYLYRAVDSSGNTIDFWLSMNRDNKLAKKFFQRALPSLHNSMPRVITADKSGATEMAILEEQYNGCLSCNVEHRSIQYLNLYYSL